MSARKSKKGAAARILMRTPGPNALRDAEPDAGRLARL